MGQKVHPYGFRLGITKTWRSRWFATHDYAKLLQEDLDLKDSLRKRLKSAGVSSIEIDRPGNKLRITIRTSRPGIIIGRKGSEIEKLKQSLARKTKREIYIDIQEVHKPELDAQLVTESIALQLEKRVAFRRAMRKAVDSALRFGCKGIKVRVSGRLNGNEIARSEWYLRGRLPLHTLRADIDYGFTQAHTTYGVLGIKAWVYKGEILDGDYHPSLRNEPEPRRLPRRDRDHKPRTAVERQRASEHPAPPPVQPPPSELPHPTESTAPILPPLAPPRPSWKQELGGEKAAARATEPKTPPEAAPGAESAPVKASEPEKALETPVGPKAEPAPVKAPEPEKAPETPVATENSAGADAPQSPAAEGSPDSAEKKE